MLHMLSQISIEYSIILEPFQGSVRDIFGLIGI